MSATQLDAVRVLTGIIRRAREAGLPSLSWGLDPYDGAGLAAQPWSLSEGERVDALAAWADHLGVKATTTRHETYTEVKVSAEVDGVPVEVFTHTDNTHKWVAVPIGADQPAATYETKTKES